MAVTGWKTPGTQANVALGGNAWSNLGNVTASDNARATVSLGINEDSDYMRLTNFGFTSSDIPSGSTIDGIELQVERVRTTGSANRISDLHIILRKTSGQVGADKANTGTFWTTTEATRTYGGAADLWTTTWSDTDITSSDFGVDFAAQCGNSANGGGVDLIQIRVYYTEASAPSITAAQTAANAEQAGSLAHPFVITGAQTANGAEQAAVLAQPFTVAAAQTLGKATTTATLNMTPDITAAQTAANAEQTASLSQASNNAAITAVQTTNNAEQAAVLAQPFTIAAAQVIAAAVQAASLALSAAVAALPKYEGLRRNVGRLLR